MRPNYSAFLSSCIALSVVPLHAPVYAQASDGSEMFLNAYSSFQKAESLEKRGDVAGALNLYQEVSKALSQLSTQFPSWSPQVVKYRAQLTLQAIQRIQTAQPEVAKSVAAAAAKPKPATASGAEATPLIPQLPQKNGVPVGPSDPFSEIQSKLSQLQNDLQFALEEAQRLRKEKAQLLKNLEDTANSATKALDENVKARAKAEDLARILEQRADVAERALLAAREDKTKTVEELSALKKERDSLVSQKRQLQAEVEASEELRRRQEARLGQTQARETSVIGERDAAAQQLAQARKQLEQAQADSERTSKAQAALTQQLEKISAERDAAKTAAAAASQDANKEREAVKSAAEKVAKDRASLDKEVAKVAKERDAAKAELAKVAQERDDALALATKLKTARGQMDKVESQSKEAGEKLAKLQKELDEQRKAGSQSEASMKALREEVEGVRSKLSEAQKKAETAEKSVTELEGKLSSAMQQMSLAKTEASQAKTEASQAVADREKEHEERELLQGILSRSLQEQSRREKARKDLVAEVSRLKVSSDALMKQIGLLGEPVLQLSEREQALFKQPMVEISEDGISISAMKTPSKNAAPDKKPAAGADPAVAKTEPAPSQSGAKAAPRNAPMTDEVRQKISEAKDRFDKGDFAVAEKLYKEVLEASPGNAFVLSNLGVTQFRAKRFAEAEETLKKALELVPEDAFSRSTLGIVYYTQGKLDKAVDELTQSVAINPSNAVAHNYLGIAASRKGWQENARKELETAAELDPTYADAYFNLAVVCASQKPADKEAARAAYKKATALGAAADARLEELIR